MQIDDVTQSLQLLDELSLGEFGASISSIIEDRDEFLAFKRLGRLSAVSVKSPFARALAYDPDLPSNWAKSRRAWMIVEPVSETAIAGDRDSYELLTSIAREWERPVGRLAEYNIFMSICRRVRPVVCGEADVLTKTERAVEEIRKSGGAATSVVSPDRIVTVASASVGPFLAAQVPELQPLVPVITTMTLMLGFFGHKKMCDYMLKFEQTYDATVDSG